MTVITIHNKSFTPYLQQQILEQRIAELAKAIEADYSSKKPIFLVVLNGAFIFAADLIRQINLTSEITFVKIASYQGQQSTQKVTDLIGLSENLANRHVVIIEDIIDTGLSIKHVLELLHKQHPKTISIVTLLFKKEALKHPIKPNYVGFEIKNKFVLGYGLDYDGLGRNLKDIYEEL